MCYRHNYSEFYTPGLDKNVPRMQLASTLHVPDHRVRADDELGSGVPLVVRDVVVGLQPNPLLPFGEEPVVAGLPFAVLHH